MRDKMRLLTPGPTPLPEEVRLTLAMDMVHHRKPGFTAVLGEVQAGLKELFGHAGPVLILTASGTGAMWAAASNLFKAKERVLVVEAGKFGERWTQIAGSHGLDCTVLCAPWGKAVTAELVAKTLDAHPDIAGVFVQASETSTGVLHPVRQIAEVTRRRNVMLVVDGISAVGISPCPMDEWGVDCLLTGSQKGLMLPPGLSFLALSPRAWERVEQTAPRNFYFDLLGERKKTLGSQTLFTPGINLIQGLHTCLDLFRQAGLDTIYRRQWALTQMCRAGIAAMGLAPLAERDYTWGLTSVRLPAGVDGGAVLKAAAERYGVVMAGGQDQLKGRIVRVGHMGYVDYGDLAAGLHALARSLRLTGGYTASRDYLEQALAAYEQALADGPPAL
ncbi:MAG: alanine--glyoxylate aminotransferase family protein [Thermodesulfobacteriota bacterium]